MSILFDCLVSQLNNTTCRTWFPLFFNIKNEKLRHSLGRPSHSDFVQFQFVELHRKCRVVTIRKKLIKLHIILTKD